jgi:hypothetical protein
MTARHLVESSRSTSEGTKNPQLETRRNTAKIVVGLTVVFLINYVPYDLENLHRRSGNLLCKNYLHYSLFEL